MSAFVRFDASWHGLGLSPLIAFDLLLDLRFHLTIH